MRPYIKSRYYLDLRSIAYAGFDIRFLLDTVLIDLYIVLARQRLYKILRYDDRIIRLFLDIAYIRNRSYLTEAGQAALELGVYRACILVALFLSLNGCFYYSTLVLLLVDSYCNFLNFLSSLTVAFTYILSGSIIVAMTLYACTFEPAFIRSAKLTSPSHGAYSLEVSYSF